MAEFINKRPELRPSNVERDGFNNIGKPIPAFRREAARSHAEAMGLDKATSIACVSSVASQLERDKPYEALEAACQFVDLTGAYRLLAVLLIEPKPHIIGPKGRVD